MANNNAPEKKFSLKGVCAAVWRRATKDGRTFASITVERRYKAQDGTWKSSNSFTSRDLMRVFIVLAQAAAYCEQADGGSAQGPQSGDQGDVEEEEEAAPLPRAPPTAPQPPATSACRRCHRPLVNAESIQRGMGPRCLLRELAGRLAVRTACEPERDLGVDALTKATAEATLPAKAI